MSFYDDIKVEQKTIKEFIKYRFFKVPKYQRGYAWKVENIDDFWQDIKDTYESKNDGHFFGSLILSKKNDFEEQSKRLEIIDGQQRVITFIIFFRVLHDLIYETGSAKDSLKKIIWKENEPRLIVGEENQRFFDYWFSQFPDKRDDRKGLRKPELLMKEAYNQLLKSVTDYARAKGRDGETMARDLWDLFDEEKLFLLSIIVPSDQDAFTIFETINAKRVDLTPSELIKNGIFARSKKYGEDVYSSVESSWTSMVDSLSNNTGVLSGDIDITDYIRHLCIARYGVAIRDKQLYREFFKFVSDKDELLDIMNSLEQEADAYASIVHKQLAYGTHNLSEFSTIYELNLVQIRPFLLSLIVKKIDKEELSSIAKIITSTLIRRSLIGSNPNELESVFISAAHSLRVEGLRALVKLKDDLTELCPSNSALESAIVVQGDARISKTILLHMEKNIDEPDAKLPGKPTLEHILPQRPRALEDFHGINIANFQYYLEQFGNLTLLAGYNPKLSNKAYEEKREVFLGSGYAITRKLAQENEHWGDKEISARTKHIYKYIIDQWPEL